MVLRIVGTKCTPAAARAAPWQVTVSMPTGQTDKRTDGRITNARFGQRNNNKSGGYAWPVFVKIPSTVDIFCLPLELCAA